MSTGPDVDARIRAGLDAAAGRFQPTRTGTEVLPDLRSRTRRREARRRVGRLVLGVTALAGAAVAGIALWPGDADRADVRVDDPADGPVATTEPESDWHVSTSEVVIGDLPAPPLDVRWKHAMVWTGRELVVWGGELDALNMGVPGPDAVYNDGAAYDPVAQRWRIMSESPLPGDSSPGGSMGGGGVASAVWTGREVVIVQAGRAAAWHPGTDRWREIADPPGDGALGLVAAGDVVVQVDRGAAWAWHPGNDEWTPLPDPPVVLSQGVVVWTGEEVIVLGSSSTAGAAYDPDTERWRELPGTGHPRAAAATWTGREVLVVDFDNTRAAAVYDPTGDAWRQLPDVPLPLRENVPSVQMVGDTPVVWSRSGTVMLVDGEWHAIAGADDLAGAPVTGAGVLWSVAPDRTTSPAEMRLAAVQPAAEQQTE